MKKILLLILAALSMQLSAQDLAHYRKIVKELSSAKYQGRGYADDGANKAGKWIAKEFTKAGVDEVVCQPFKLNINTFPGKMEVKVDGPGSVPHFPARKSPKVDIGAAKFPPASSKARRSSIRWNSIGSG